MFRIGLTGGIGSGKSTVTRLFAAHGALIVDTDEIAHTLVMPGRPELKRIFEVFGSTVIDQHGDLDRAAMRRRIFADAKARQLLESILHPPIRAEVRKRLSATRAPYAIVVVPLLIEAGFTDLVDRVLVVDARAEDQIRRTVQRSGLTEAEVRSIMDSQIDAAERLRQADDVIDNRGDLGALEAEVNRLDQRYRALETAARGDED